MAHPAADCVKAWGFTKAPEALSCTQPGTHLQAHSRTKPAPPGLPNHWAVKALVPHVHARSALLGGVSHSLSLVSEAHTTICKAKAIHPSIFPPNSALLSAKARAGDLFHCSHSGRVGWTHCKADPHKTSLTPCFPFPSFCSCCCLRGQDTPVFHPHHVTHIGFIIPRRFPDTSPSCWGRKSGPSSSLEIGRDLCAQRAH
jgi:hypothetical protein